MFYRRKQYVVKESFVENFNRHFNQTLLPTQLKSGARLVGRWMIRGSEDVEVFAIWEYDSYEDYERIEADVRNDKEHVHNVLKWYNDNGGREFVIKSHFLQVENEKLENTVI